MAIKITIARLYVATNNCGKFYSTTTPHIYIHTVKQPVTNSYLGHIRSLSDSVGSLLASLVYNNATPLSLQ